MFPDQNNICICNFEYDKIKNANLSASPVIV